MSLRLCFENEHFVSVDKAPGQLSVPSRLGALDTRPVVGRLLEKQLGLRLFPVHRLDLEVSGLLLFAKNAEAHRAANQAFEHHQVRKQYRAYTSPAAGLPPTSRQRWENLLVRGKKRSFEAAHGQRALTEAQFLRACTVENLEAWEWELFPLTGRAHQLRWHLGHFAAPILGDRLYGSAVDWPPGGIALRAEALDLSQSPALLNLGLPPLLSLKDQDAGSARK